MHTYFISSSMLASSLTMLAPSTNALAGLRVAPCCKTTPLGRASSLMMAVETGDTLVEDNLGAASESGYTCEPPPFEPPTHRLAASYLTDPVRSVPRLARAGVGQGGSPQDSARARRL